MFKKIGRFIKNAARTIGRTAGGDNKTGELIHGVLDLLPVPNQPLGKLMKAVLAGEWSAAKDEVGKLITVRNVVALVVAFCIVNGWLTVEQIQNFIEVFTNVKEWLSHI